MMSKMNFKSLLISCLIAVAMGRTAFTKTIYVDDDAAGANDGSSWRDAYNYLQDALVDATSAEKPVEIVVAQGVYKPDQGRGKVPHDQKATFQLINSVTLKGGFAGFDEPDPNARDVSLYETILSGDLKDNDIVVKYAGDLLDESSRNDNSYCVVTSSMVHKTAVLNGFTITAGNHHGMCNKNGSPTVIDCTFRGNRAERWGGGVCNENGNPSIRRCTFIQNYAKYGGGIWSSKGSLFVTSCVFSNNSAKYGGAIYNYDNSNPQIYNCAFSRNSAKYGVGIYSNKNCRPKITNCTFAGNSADCKGGVIHNIHDSRLILTNSILWNNSPDEHEIVNYFKSSSTVSYCNIQDGTGQLWFGEGCIDANPLFAGHDNLRLLPGSPCIDAGDNTAVLEIVKSLDGEQSFTNNIVDMGAFEGDSF
jgi:predicted outer membrane repeat protein